MKTKVAFELQELEKMVLKYNSKYLSDYFLVNTMGVLHDVGVSLEKQAEYFNCDMDTILKGIEQYKWRNN